MRATRRRVGGLFPFVGLLVAGVALTVWWDRRAFSETDTGAASTGGTASDGSVEATETPEAGAKPTGGDGA